MYCEQVALRGKAPPTPDDAPTPAPAGGSETSAEKERALLCARCAHPITLERLRIEVGGSHTHTRLNPAGVVFHFGCFSAADGATASGEPTPEDSWFAGYLWQYAHCAACATHLGWHFVGAAPFFGLVLDRLRAEE